MKKIYLFLLIAFSGFLILFVYLTHIGNSKRRGERVSETIKKSVEVNAFKAAYELETMSPTLSDSLNKYGLPHVKLPSLEYWIERKWRIEPKYLFFEKVNILKKLRLLITDPTSLLKNNGPPFIGFKLKNSSELSLSKGAGGAVCILNIDSIPERINLEVYIEVDNTDDKYIGDITIKQFSKGLVE